MKFRKNECNRLHLYALIITKNYKTIICQKIGGKKNRKGLFIFS